MYNFEEGDFVICKPSEEKRNDSNKNFEIYAYVVEVNRDKDTLRLDRYLKQGRLHIEKSPEFHLKEMEKDGFYQPMNDYEIADFYDGVAELLSDARFLNNLYSNDVHQVFEALDAAMNDMTREIV